MNAWQDWPSGLPVPLTSFVGRVRELPQVARLVSARRLVTLVGAGGVGKTRLAIEAAVAVSARFGDGVDFIDLSAVTSPDRLPGAVAAALGVEERAGAELEERLVQVLRGQRRLLVLDNCEHLRDRCGTLAVEVVSRCPDVTVLATGRESLGVSGEVAWRVPSLACPAEADTPTLDELEGYDAAALFLARARDSRAGLVIRPGEAPAIASICRRLDGIALALELAAARVAALSVGEIAGRLTGRFDLLTRSGAGPSRQLSLRASVEWSHKLLGVADRVLFARLAVFAGGWSLDDAEAVCSAPPLSGADVTASLAAMVDKSLVQVDQAEGSWYRLPPPIQAFAREQLAESGELELLRARHGRYFAQLGERSAPLLIGPEQAAWASRLDREAENLRVARHWCKERGERAELGLRLAAGLWEYWQVRGLIEDGVDWLEEALDRGSGPPGLRAAALNGLGVLVSARGELERGSTLLGQAVRLYREAGDPCGEARAWTHLGNVRTFGDDHAGAAAALERGLGLARQAPGSWHEAWALFMCGLADTMTGNTAAARARMAESEALFGRHGDHRAVGYTRIVLADCMVRDGQAADAVQVLREAMDILGVLPDRFGLTQASCMLAIAAALTGDWPRVATVLGVIDSLSERISVSLFPPVQEAIAALAKAASDELGEKMQPVRETGQLIGRSDAIATALWPSADRVPARATVAEAGRRLTRREQEVADLIADGLTNKQIARRLVIAKRTADTHVQRILVKLGCANRAQIAVIVATGQPEPGAFP